MNILIVKIILGSDTLAKVWSIQYKNIIDEEMLNVEKKKGSYDERNTEKVRIKSGIFFSFINYFRNSNIRFPLEIFIGNCESILYKLWQECSS